jgi:MarR family 2-MHQ and catechol resistance regulon transcriptional repressor
MPSRYNGTPDEVLALNTLIKLNRSVNALSSHLIPLIHKDFGITESQFAVLEALYHLGPLSQGQLCQKILRSGSNLTTVVDNLERNNLVRRERDVEDRRVQIVTLTAQGKEVIEAALPEHIARVSQVMSVLTADEQAELGRICLKLGKSIPRQNE